MAAAPAPANALQLQPNKRPRLALGDGGGAPNALALVPVQRQLTPEQKARRTLLASLERAQRSALDGQQMALAFAQNMLDEANVFAAAKDVLQRMIDAE